jgi:hypothetical protein
MSWAIVIGLFLLEHGLIHVATYAPPTAADAPFDPGHCGPLLSQGKEEPLQVIAVNLGLLGSRIRAGHALLQAGCDNPEAHSIEGPRGRRELGDDFLAIAARLEHLDEPAELPLNLSQPDSDITKGVLVELHRRAPRSC